MDAFAEQPRAAPGGQLMWTDAAVEVQRNRGREQGGLDAEKSESNRSLAALHEEPKLEPQTLSLLAEHAGISADRQDASQLVAATAYVNRGATREEQQARLATALDNLTVLDRIGPPKLEDEEFVELMWNAARIPGHAIDGLPPERRAAAFQQVASALNTPGQHQLKVEKYDVKLSVGDGGQVLNSSTKKPSPWKTIGKVALNVGLGVAAAFTGGAALVAVKAVQLGMSAYQGIKSAVKGDWLGAVGGFAGAFGGVAGATTGATSTATKLANTVARGAGAAQGAVVAVKTGSIAGLAGAAAEGLGAVSSFSPANVKLAQAAKVTGRVAQGAGAVESAAHGDLVGAAMQGATLVKELRQKKPLEARNIDLGLMSAVPAPQGSSPALLEARPLALGVASAAPAVQGRSPKLLEAKPLALGLASLAPVLTGTKPAAAPIPSADVRAVQNALRSTGIAVTADGIVGPKTREALKQFQRENGLRVTGDIDAATVQALGRERDVAYAAPAARSNAAERLQLDLARADVKLQLEAEVWRTQQLLQQGNRGNAVAHAAQRYLDALRHAQAEVPKARDRYELEAAQYVLKTPGEVLSKLITVDRNLNRDLKEVGKWWVTTAAKTAAWFAPPVAGAAMLASGVGTAALSEGTLNERLVAGGTEVLKDYLRGKVVDRFGAAVAKQLDGHFKQAALERLQEAINKGDDLQQIIDGFLKMGPQESGDR